MKKIRNVENAFEFETVVFSFSEEQILRELIAESSYVAKSIVGQSDLKSGWSRSIIFSEDVYKRQTQPYHIHLVFGEA